MVRQNRDALTIRDSIGRYSKKGAFFAKEQCGGQQRTRGLQPGCKPRFAGVAVCTRVAKGGEFNSHPLPMRRAGYAEIERQIHSITCGARCAGEEKGCPLHGHRCGCDGLQNLEVTAIDGG